MKKIITLITITLLGFTLMGCQPNEIPEDEIHVGVSFFPMKEILELIEGDLNEAGYKLVIKEANDYQVWNDALKNRELDANMIQHDYFLQEFNKANDTDLVTVLPIYHATFALYSKDYTDIDQIPNGATITIPDDATNRSRAFYLLGQAGLLEFKDNKTTGLTEADIVVNKKNLKFDEIGLTDIAGRYKETKLAIMYPTYARKLELVGDEQRLYVEKQDDVTSGFAISLVSRNDNKDSKKMQTLIELIKTDKVRDFLNKEYSWASTPAF